MVSRPEKNNDDIESRLIYGRNYADWSNSATMKGLTLVRALDRWLETCYSKEFIPHAHMSIAAFGMCIMVNDHCVWDSENDSEDNLTVDYCKEKLKQHALYMMTPFE